jgi:hypothetical protein
MAAEDDSCASLLQVTYRWHSLLESRGVCDGARGLVLGSGRQAGLVGPEQTSPHAICRRAHLRNIKVDPHKHTLALDHAGWHVRE